VEIIVEDRPGLLYGISSTFAELGCNIEVGLIETEVAPPRTFLCDKGGAKLNPDLRRALQASLEDRVSLVRAQR